MIRPLSTSLGFILACSAVYAAPGQDAAPAPQAPATVQAAAVAPESARGRVFEFICRGLSPAEGAESGTLSVFDRSCTFRSMDRAEVEIIRDDAPDDEHLMRVYTYTKTGVDTATVVCSETMVYDDGREEGLSTMEIRLTFTGEDSGTAAFTAGGSHGAGSFSLHR